MLILKVIAMNRRSRRIRLGEYSGLQEYFGPRKGFGAPCRRTVRKVSKSSLCLLLISMMTLLLIGCVPRASVLTATDNLTDYERAQSTLLEFLNNLHNGKYEQVARVYGGSYQTMIDQNPDIGPDDRSTLLRNACALNGMQCLRAKIIGVEEEIPNEKYEFVVEFLRQDGTPFTQRPCCGEDEGSFPHQSIFLFTVLKVDQNEFTVMNLPPYAP
jgi:hypothetical protein